MVSPNTPSPQSNPQGIVIQIPPKPEERAASIFSGTTTVHKRFEPENTPDEDKQKDEWGEKFEIPAFLRQGR
jgi:hypothetical protein